MRVSVDAERCQGHALCVLFGPGIFTLDDHGHATVEDVEVPPGLEDAVRAAAARCPERAIVLEAETPVPAKRGTL
jgi:ferredoxin